MEPSIESIYIYLSASTHSFSRQSHANFEVSQVNIPCTMQNFLQICLENGPLLTKSVAALQISIRAVLLSFYIADTFKVLSHE